MSNFLSIQKTSNCLGISNQTLRRWDKQGKLKPIRDIKTGYRYYNDQIIIDFIKNNLILLGKKWATVKNIGEPHESVYCSNSAVFQIRLSQFQNELARDPHSQVIISLLVAIVGEIGNNSFDHNLGNWPDIPGIFFGYNLSTRQVLLADRGLGILHTLQRVRPDIINHEQALNIAFTEIITGRAPENRGNGLKFVRQAVISSSINLQFQTGNAFLSIKKDDTFLKVNKSLKNIHGCLAIINF